MRHIFIGDVHGMLDELNALLDQLAPSLEDQIIFVGDLLDKGPDSPGVVRRVRTLSETHNVILVMGNHEDTHSRYRTHTSERPNTAKKMAQNKPELPVITPQLSEKDIAFLNTAVLFHRIPEHNILVVHGGIPNNIEHLPKDMSAFHKLRSKDRKSLKLLMRTRYLDAKKGSFVGLGEEKEHDPYWADVYDGRFGHVIFGHQPFMNGVRQFPFATGIDTGAVFGGTLTALIVKDTEDRKFVSIPSRKFANEHDYMKNSTL